ncbi:hypothetical protein [Cupriavidus pinatubonensis]|uniref:Monooxygenase n=1 Tax=Cupriavidus pinatubonensis TaxID=248026 RepID=A0ABM8Y0T5_9BURK|nr:hypothetical protein [Cupriavidus pinatubonensis]CAG9186324.1 hypothetical protein LMG23994_06163 [Cupriavidus pinatubonensis]
MKTILVLFSLPDGMSRQEFVAHCSKTAEHWKENPALLHKTYLYEPKARQGGAVFLWQDSTAAEQALGDAWRQQMTQFYGAEPVVQYFETPLVIDGGELRGIDEGSA